MRDIHGFTQDISRLGGAVLRTCAAADALVAVGNVITRANGGASAAMDAAARLIGYLPNAGLAFGIMAPRAPKRTAFQEEGRADAWTIMQAEALDVENHPGFC